MKSDHENYKMLFNALKNNNYNEAEALLSQGEGIHHTNSKDEDLLWNAFNLNNLSMVLWLIKKGLNIDNLNSYEESILSKMINKNNIEMLKIALSISKKNINKESIKGLTPLMIACLENKKDIVELLINNGCDINKKNKYGNTALSIAVYNSDEETIKYLLENGADMSISNNEGDTPLILSAKYRKTENLYLLLEYSTTENINQENIYGSSIVSFIFNSEYFYFAPENIVDILIEKKANFNINIAGERYSSPFLEVIKMEDIESFSKIIETENINVNIIDKEGNDIFHYLSIIGSLTPYLLDKIISCGYEVKKQKSKIGLNPYYALLKTTANDQDMEYMVNVIKECDFKNAYNIDLSIEDLLDSCLSNRLYQHLNIFIKTDVIDITKIYEKGNTIVHKIKNLLQETEEVGILILEEELKDYKQNLENYTDYDYKEEILKYVKEQEDAIHFMKTSMMSCIDIILEKGKENHFDINIKNDEGETILMSVIENNQILILDYLLTRNPDILLENNYGENSLCYAIKNGNNEIFFKLLNIIGTNKNILSNLLINLIYNCPEDKYKKDILLSSIENIIELLIPYINNKDEDGNSPLIIASAINDIDIIKLLLKYNADPNIKNNKNETSLMHACFNKNKEAINLLLEKKANKKLKIMMV